MMWWLLLVALANNHPMPRPTEPYVWTSTDTIFAWCMVAFVVASIFGIWRITRGVMIDFTVGLTSSAPPPPPYLR